VRVEEAVRQVGSEKGGRNVVTAEETGSERGEANELREGQDEEQADEGGGQELDGKIRRVWHRRKHGLEDFLTRPGSHDCRAMFGETRGDLHDLLGALALTEYDFGEALAHVTVMVDTREPEVFEGERSEPCHRLVDVRGAVSDADEEVAYLIRSHRGAIPSSVTIRLTARCLYPVYSYGRAVTPGCLDHMEVRRSTT